VSQLRTGVKWQENLENRISEETQITATKLTGASSTVLNDIWSMVKAQEACLTTSTAYCQGRVQLKRSTGLKIIQPY
jgi:hypothetical protein